MKKKLRLLALLLCMIFAFTACSKDDDADSQEAKPSASSDADKKDDSDKKSEKVSTDDPTSVDDLDKLDTNVDDIDLSKYMIKLGNYKKVDIKVLSTEVTDEEVQNEIATMLAQYPTYDEVEKAAAEDGDLVDISFVGTMNGEKFDGGTLDNQILGLGSGDYIPGFESGVVGMKKGETKKLDLTFPESYSNTDYAGKEVTFEVTLNRIVKAADTVFNDKFVTSNFKESQGWTTTTDCENAIKESLKSEKEEKSNSQKTQSVLDAVMDDSEFAKELPQNYINKYYVEEYTYYSSVAESYSIDFETYLNYYQVTLDEFKKQCLEYATKAVKEDITLYAIAQAEKIEITDDYYTEQINSIFKDYSAYYDDVNAFVTDNGGKEEVTKKLLFIKVRDQIVADANVTATVDSLDEDTDAADTTTSDTKATAEPEATKAAE